VPWLYKPFFEHPRLTALLFYVIAVLGVHGSALPEMSDSLFGGGLAAHVVVWELDWAWRLARGAASLAAPELFFPLGTPVIYLSPLLLALSLPLTASLGAATAFNALFLLSYLAAAFCMYLLAEHLLGEGLHAWLAGFLFAFSHYSLTQHVIGQLQETLIFVLPLLALALLRYSAKPDRQATALLCGAIALTVTASAYIAFAALGVLAPTLMIAQWRHANVAQRRALVPGWAAAGLVAGIVGLLGYLPVLLHATQLSGGQGTHALSVLSLVDYPFWHPAPWAKALRSLSSGFAIDTPSLARAGLSNRTSPERLLGFLSVTVMALTVLGGYARSLPRRWLVLGASAFILSFGATLSVTFAPSAVPLPYALFTHIPGLAMFRSPARMMALVWMVCALLAGGGFAYATRKLDWAKRWGILVMLVGFYSKETALSAAGSRWVTLNDEPVYAHIAAHPGPVLELPVALKKDGELSINAEVFMTGQLQHRSPLVVARPTRYSTRSLALLMSHDFVYELTHPETLSALRNNPPLKERRRKLIREGRVLLKAQGIRYIVLHRADGFFSPTVLNEYTALLDAALGPPTLTQPNGLTLYAL
jgi:hypothetical protein